MVLSEAELRTPGPLGGTDRPSSKAKGSPLVGESESHGGMVPEAAPGRQLCRGPGWGAGWAVDHHLNLHHPLPAQRVLQRHRDPLQGEVDLLLGGGAEAHDRARLQEHDRAGGLGPALLGGCPGLPLTPHRNRVHPFMPLGLLPGPLSALPPRPSDLTATLGLHLHPRLVDTMGCILPLNPRLETQHDSRLCPQPELMDTC
ncbi:uncharacterized protein LOC118357049 [Zalophus californianus]|uniref:Uncharacterized protein LOC118357048 n=1 Tax=Zalophus californianus TaxID=9704 RepID=A0A6P9F9A4_ZALCA|nr:uncharacterized protein LOC118357048 [Zalophus californianus]XP_035583796.1 uncharacterized protein LOC118357049 [Zalophus californianus]